MRQWRVSIDPSASGSRSDKQLRRRRPDASCAAQITRASIESLELRTLLSAGIANPSEPPPFNESLVVTTTADEDNGTSDPAYGSGTSLREAINYANENPDASTITFDLGAGPHTITYSSAAQAIFTDASVIGPGADLLNVRGSGDSFVFYTYALDNISGLTVSNGAGGIYNSGMLTVSRCVVTGNSALGGAGVYNEGGTVTIENTTISDNTAGFGGGIFNEDGALFLRNSTLSGNKAVVTDSPDDSGFGGGIFNSDGAVTITDSTLTANSAASNGGAIANDIFFGEAKGTIAVTNSTIAGNSAGGSGGGIFAGNSLTLNNTIVAKNTAPNDPNVSGSFTGGNNFTSGDPKLRPLADNGGSTQTMALLPGSPCVNAGSNAAAVAAGLTTDQRGPGFPRIVGGTVDIGAFEVQTRGLIEDLIFRVGLLAQKGTINSGRCNALTNPLNNALDRFDAGQTKQTIQQLGVFLNQIDARLKALNPKQSGCSMDLAALLALKTEAQGVIGDLV